MDNSRGGSPTTEEMDRLKSDNKGQAARGRSPGSGPQTGGSFAPPLSDELLAKYKVMVEALTPSPVKDAMEKLLHCCGVWWELPDSNNGSRPHPVGVGAIRHLDEAHKKALWDHIPWSHRSNGKDVNGNPIKGELDHMQDLLETISNETQRDLRNAAHHLLWHVIELDLDREPITSDKL